jgi:AAA+ superfamily predicted ATPase
LGSDIAKDKLEKWSWFLFYGAMGTGKTLAIRALQK